MRRHMRRHLLLVLAVVSASVVLAIPALAHVTVQPGEAEQGGFTKLAFRVPNETDDTDTVKVEVQFPDDAPLPSVSVKPKQGWTYTIDKRKLATPIKGEDGDITEVVSKLTWQGGAIKPGEFDEFEVSVGPLPKVDTMVFKTLQTYSDGNVVRWIETQAAGQPEPEHPAPTLKLVAETSSATPAPSASPAGGSSSSSTATAALIVAIVAAVLALAGLALARRRPRSASIT